MIESIDHLVLTVRNLAASISFYERLGMEHVEFGNGRHALAFGSQKINLHQFGNEFEPKAFQPTPGSADLCFVVNVAIEQVLEVLQRSAISVVEGPVSRTGARGPIVSVYIRDPDQNLVELSSYQ